ncbi:hypothetical protein LDENG_00026560 [Lucifuga dentata]|nr:hypothetical protein LDENG_00026560 [Lucifuga dentata]
MQTWSQINVVMEVSMDDFQGRIMKKAKKSRFKGSDEGVDGGDVTGCENMSQSPCESVPSGTGALNSQTANGCSPQHQDSKTQNTDESTKTECEGASSSLKLMRNAVVVLTSLPEYEIAALRPPTPQQFYSEDESESSSESDSDDWELEEDYNDSDYSLCNHHRKKRKLTKSNAKKSSSSQANSATHELGHSSNEAAIAPPNLTQQEISVDMMVIAMRRHMRWQRGKIVEIKTKEDGNTKYKVSFEDKGKIRVSGHHIAFDSTPTLDQLDVGTRVVVRSETNDTCYMPGVLAELPSRNNRCRFLVFLDDHTPMYVGLPLLHLVCRPLREVLDDIPDMTHRNFMKEYIRNWPYPHISYYNVGQIVNADCNGEMKKCEVQVLDCSLIHVIFQEDRHEEWIYRGSIRLQPYDSSLEDGGGAAAQA